MKIENENGEEYAMDRAKDSKKIAQEYRRNVENFSDKNSTLFSFLCYGCCCCCCNISFAHDADSDQKMYITCRHETLCICATTTVCRCEFGRIKVARLQNSFNFSRFTNSDVQFISIFDLINGN